MKKKKYLNLSNKSEVSTSDNTRISTNPSTVRFGKTERLSDYIEFTKDQEAYNKAKFTKEPDASVDNFVKGVSPLPGNVDSYLGKTLFGRNRMNTESLSREEKAVIAKTAYNAYQRTGKLSGGTEYEDYKGTTTDRVYGEIERLKQGKTNPLIGATLGKFDAAYNMASTTGRGSYAINPDNKDELVYTDEYNFKNKLSHNPDGTVKEDYIEAKTGDKLVDFYRKMRRNAAIRETTEKGANDGKIKFTLRSSDTNYLPRRSK
jgi:hypothetical protein